MWVKWARNQNKTQTTIVDSEKEFYELLTCSDTEVTNPIFPNDDVSWVSCKYSEDNVAAGKNVNVAVYAYVTTLARLKLYEYLSKMGSPFCTVMQTRSSSFRNIMTPKIQNMDYLGDLTYELEEYGYFSFIKEVVSGGPKNYAFSVFWPSNGKLETKCEVKDITLNYENSNVKFATLRNMFLENAAPVHVHKPSNIKRKIVV